jgi:hypothetical protein
MIRECFKTKSGIMFDRKKLREFDLDPDRLWPRVESRPAPLPLGSTKIRNIPPPGEHPKEFHEHPESEEAHELLDATSPIHDEMELKNKWWWRFLDRLPLEKTYQGPDGKWDKTHERVLSQP